MRTRSWMIRSLATAPRSLALLRAGLATALAVVGCGDSATESDALSAGAVCEGAAPTTCEASCDAVCDAGSWKCACPESASTGSTIATTSGTTSDATTSGGEVSASASDGSTSDAATTTSDGTTTSAGEPTSSTTAGKTTSSTSDGSSTSSTSSTTEEPWDELQHVHIEIDNFCQVSVDPPEIYVPVDETVTLSYHNHSVDYQADVWLSYGGGYLELELGKTWDDAFEWCTGPNASTGYADISIAGGGNNACPKHRMKIHCE